MTTATIVSAYNPADIVFYNNRPMFLLDSYHSVQQFAEKIGAHEFRVYLFDTETAEVAEDCEAQIFGTENLIKWLMANNLYNSGNDSLAYTVDMFNANGEMLTDYDIVC